MDEAKVRRKLEGALRRPLTEAEWRALERAGYIEELLNQSPGEDFEETWREYKDLIVIPYLEGLEAFYEDKIQEGQGVPFTRAEGLRPREEPEKLSEEGFSSDDTGSESHLELSDYTRIRGLAFSEYIADLASRIPEVSKFRSEVLQKRLAPQEAHALLGSPAAAFFAPKWFEDWSIPLVGHTAHLVEPYEEGLPGGQVDHRATVRVDPPGVTKRVRCAHPDAPVPDEVSVDAQALVVRSRQPAVPDYVRCRLWRKLSYALDDRGENRSRRKSRRRLYLWPGSVLDRLRRIGLELADKFEWGEDEAIWFVLTGEIPRIRPLRAGKTFRGQRTIHGAVDGDYELWSIRIHAAPWVPAEEVARAYRQVQQDLLQGRNRKMGSSKTGPRALEVYRFVREQERLNGARPSYPKLLALWNSQYPGKRFRGDYPGNLRTYFERGECAIEAPEYKSPWKDRQRNQRDAT